MWPLMFDPLVNPTKLPKLVLGITQVGIVIDHREPSDEENEYFERTYHEQRGQPSSIGNANGLPTNRRNVPTSNSGGEPFNNGGDSSSPKVGNKGPPRGGGNRPLKD